MALGLTRGTAGRFPLRELLRRGMKRVRAEHRGWQAVWLFGVEKTPGSRAGLATGRVGRGGSDDRLGGMRGYVAPINEPGTVRYSVRSDSVCGPPRLRLRRLQRPFAVVATNFSSRIAGKRQRASQRYAEFRGYRHERLLEQRCHLGTFRLRLQRGHLRFALECGLYWGHL